MVRPVSIVLLAMCLLAGVPRNARAQGDTARPTPPPAVAPPGLYEVASPFGAAELEVMELAPEQYAVVLAVPAPWRAARIAEVALGGPEPGIHLVEVWYRQTPAGDGVWQRVAGIVFGAR